MTCMAFLLIKFSNVNNYITIKIYGLTYVYKYEILHLFIFISFFGINNFFILNIYLI